MHMWKKLIKRLFTEDDFRQFVNGVSGSMDFSDAVKKKSRVLYFLLIVFLIAVMMAPAMTYCFWLETGGAPNSEHGLINACYGVIGWVGLVGALILGVATVNEVMRLCHGYLGWKVTVLCACVGGVVTLLCAGLLHLAAMIGL